MNGKSAVIGILFLFCVRILTAQALGDANKDGKVDIVDALNIARVYVGIEIDNFDPHFGDVNIDDKINIVDSVLVAQNYVGIEPILPTYLKDIITPDYPANWDIVMQIFPSLTPTQSQLLFENGFLILEDTDEDTVSAAYEKYINEPRFPKIITIDSLFHIFHLTLSHMNETVERKNLFPALQEFLLGLSNQLKSEYFSMLPSDPFYRATEKLLIRIIVAKNLIEGTVYNENDLPSHFAILINSYLQKVRNHNLVDNEEDYTSYTPRGHYANNPNYEHRKRLIRYFLSLTWLQRYVLDINEYTDLRQIILFTNLVSNNALLSEHFNFINYFLVKIKGLSGDFTLDQIESTLQTAQPDSYHVSGYHAFDSNESILTLLEILKNQTGVSQFFRLITKVETPDMAVLKNTHAPLIENRKWPSGLDVAAGFFDSPAALNILGESPYGDQLLSVFEALSQQNSDFFDSELNDSVVWRWFKILRDLSYDIPSSISYTDIDQDKWRIKQLNTQLSSWTEYYSDTANYEAPTPEPTMDATPSPEVVDGEVMFRIEPAQLDVPNNTPFSLKIMLDIKNSNLAAYGINIEYGRDLLSIDKSNHPEGVASGVDGFFTVAALTPTGLLKISGFDVNGIGPGDDLHLVTIDFVSKNQAGTTAISLSINVLTNAGTQDIFGNECVSYVTVGAPGSIRYGDVNGDNLVDIVDALFIARYFVSMNPQYINFEAADVDGNDRVNIVDALLIAQFYVGLIDNFPGVTSTPVPGITPTPTYSTGTPTPTPNVTPVPSETPKPDSGYQFVEPCSSAFENMAILAEAVGEFLSEKQIASDHMEKFYELSDMAMELSIIADASNTNHRLTDEQRNYINNWGFKISKEYFFVDDLSSFINEDEGNTRVIADVYSYHDSVLNVGVGPLKTLLMIMNYPDDNRTFVAVGYVLSYYELHDENYTRYTIEDWEAKLNRREVYQPDWFMPLMTTPIPTSELSYDLSALNLH